MMYSAGLPILYIIGFFTFLFAYLFQKCYLLKYHRKTTAFDQEMAFDTIVFFRIAAVLHLGMSAVMLTNKNILSVTDLHYLDEINVVKDVSIVDQYVNNNTFSSRFSDGIGLIYLLFTFIIAFQFIFRKLVGSLLIQIFKSLCGVACACCIQSDDQREREKSFRRRKGAAEGKDTFSKSFFGDLKIQPLSDLYSRTLIELEEMKWDEMPRGVSLNEY